MVENKATTRTASASSKVYNRIYTATIRHLVGQRINVPADEVSQVLVASHTAAAKAVASLCPRCEGTGYTPFTWVDGGRCFRCNWSGKTETGMSPRLDAEYMAAL